MTEESILENSILYVTCFFCDESCVGQDIHDMYPETKILGGSIGNKAICTDCAIDVYDMINTIAEAEEELIEEETMLQEQGS